MTLTATLRRWLGARPETSPGAAGTTAAPQPASAAQPAPEAPSVPPAPLARLVDACRVAGFIDAAGWAAAAREPMQRAEITTPLRVAEFLANTAHETGGGVRLVESFDYSADRLKAVFGLRATPEALALCRTEDRRAQPEALANVLYGGAWGTKNLGNDKPGDGWKWRGRGAIQVTGKWNYTRLAAEFGISRDDLAARMETRLGAVDTAARWWMIAGVNALADSGDCAAVRKRVNGGSVGLDDVRRRRDAVLRALS